MWWSHSAGVVWARCSRCFTNIRVLMVSGLRHARRRETVSWLPEKMRSTAMADPVWVGYEDDQLIGKKRLTWDWKDIPCKPREVGELQVTTSPPFQRVAAVKALAREPEVLLDFIRERLRKGSVTQCEIYILRVICCSSWCCQYCGSWERFIVHLTEMTMELFFAQLKVGVGIHFTFTVHEKATIRYPRVKDFKDHQ